MSQRTSLAVYRNAPAAEHDVGTGPPGFEPGFEAPEASVMSKLYYGPVRDIFAATAVGYWLCGGGVRPDSPDVGRSVTSRVGRKGEAVPGLFPT